MTVAPLVDGLDVASAGELAKALAVKPGTKLDADDALSQVAYDKGAWFLHFLEERFGAVGEVFDPTLHEALMATESTEVTETEQDDQDVDPASVEVSMADAIEAASADQDGTVTEVSLDEDDGTIAWQVEFDDEIDVDVDASSGDVIGVDR